MKTNILLLIAIICLSLILYFEPGLEQPQRDYLTVLSSDQIQSISIQRKGLESIELLKTEHGWFMTSPFQLAANPLRIDTITALAEKRSFSHFSAVAQSLQKYQLDDPLITVTLDNTTISIGAEEPIQKHRYALLDDTIHLIDGTVYYQLRANLDNFIALSLLPPEATINAIETSDWKLMVEQGHWRLTPDDPEISADSISTLLYNWNNAQALRVQTKTVAQTKQESPSDAAGSNFISVTLEGQTPVQYRLSGTDRQPELIRLPWNIAYQITPQLYQMLTDFGSRQ